MYYESEQTIRDLVAAYETTRTGKALQALIDFLQQTGNYVIYGHGRDAEDWNIDSIVLDAAIDPNGYWYCIEF